MITLIQGQDTLTSRKYFLDQKTNDSITFDAESLSIDELSQTLSGGGLFENPKKIFIENLFTRKGSKNITLIGEILNTNENAEVFIWADKEIGVKTLTNFPKIKNENFKIPQTIWSFVDSIKPNNPKNITLFHTSLNTSEPDFIFAMIIRQFRLLLAIKLKAQNLDEIKRLAPWQVSKLEKQASLFSEVKLKNIYKKLYKIDKNQKTGASNLNLIQSIDILLLEI